MAFKRVFGRTRTTTNNKLVTSIPQFSLPRLTPSSTATSTSTLHISSSSKSSVCGSARHITLTSYADQFEEPGFRDKSEHKPDMLLFEEDRRYIVNTYARFPIQLVGGVGSYLVGENHATYLDFTSGIAVNSLGHNHPEWVKAVQAQAAKLTHVSNIYYSRPQVEVAKFLVEHSSFDKVFFCNSGTEANEAAIKFARKFAYMETNSSPEKPNKKTRIISFTNAFHGRTMGSLSATYKQQYKEPFLPLVDGVEFVQYNDIEGVKKAITDDVCAVIVEPIQGEGGVYNATAEFLNTIRACTSRVGALMICDEIQTGLGRAGYFFAHEHFNIKPDIVTVAKPLANGLPIGATLLTENVAKFLKPGDHGTTFGGGPLVCTAALATLNIIGTSQFLATVRLRSKFLVHSLLQLRDELEHKHTKIRIVDIRVLGYDYGSNTGEPTSLLIGVDLNVPVAPILRTAAELGLLLITGGEKTLRLAPPLTISEQEIEDGIRLLTVAIEELSVEKKRDIGFSFAKPVAAYSDLYPKTEEVHLVRPSQLSNYLKYRENEVSAKIADSQRVNFPEQNADAAARQLRARWYMALSMAALVGIGAWIVSKNNELEAARKQIVALAYEIEQEQKKKKEDAKSSK